MIGRVARIAACSLLGVSGCGGVSPPALADTAELVHAPAAAARVDALAREHQVESERIGYGGEPSSSYAVFAAVVQESSREDVIALLRHRSAVVRGYAANYVVAQRPRDVGALRPLLADDTVVSYLDGCVSMQMAIGDRVARQLCGVPGAEAQRLLEELASLDLPRAAIARACLQER
jgi:hypothetical protein